MLWMMQNHDSYMTKGVRSKRPFQDWISDAKDALYAAGNVFQRFTRLEKALINRIEEMDTNKDISDRKTQQLVDLLNQLIAVGKPIMDMSTKSISC